MNVSKRNQRKRKRNYRNQYLDSESDIELTDESEEEDELTEKSTTDDDIEVILEDDDDSEESAIESLMDIDIHEEINESGEDDDSEYDELDNAYSELVDENALDNTEDVI